MRRRHFDSESRAAHEAPAQSRDAEVPGKMTARLECVSKIVVAVARQQLSTALHRIDRFTSELFYSLNYDYYS